MIWGARRPGIFLCGIDCTLLLPLQGCDSHAFNGLIKIDTWMRRSVKYSSGLYFFNDHKPSICRCNDGTICVNAPLPFTGRRKKRESEKSGALKVMIKMIQLRTGSVIADDQSKTKESVTPNGMVATAIVVKPSL